MATSAELSLFAVCLPGLEPLVAGELAAARIRDPRPESGGVAFAGDLQAVYRINLAAGLVSHLLIRVAEFGARSLKDLDLRGARIDWSRWLVPGTPVAVKASCRRSRIYHSGAAAERITRHLAERAGARPEPAALPDGEPPVRVRVRLQDNRCTISLDSSGAPLHRRGWRLAAGPAPLREDLARALVLASGWDRNSPLLDPMMGSGTIPIEAAILARGLAPGRGRRFACELFATHDAGLLEAVRAAAEESAAAALPFRIFGSDRDPDAVRAARANAERAGVAADLDLAQRPLSEAVPDPPAAGTGAMVTNPPYGHRLGEADALPQLYRALGDLGRRLPGWRVAIAAADRRLALRSGLPLQSAFLADSGGLKIRALCAGPPAPGTPPPS